MMASGWRVVGDIIRDLAEDGLDDVTIKLQLKTSKSMRSRFLVLYDTVNVLVQAGQKNFGVLATTAGVFYFLHYLVLCLILGRLLVRALHAVLQISQRPGIWQARVLV